MKLQLQLQRSVANRQFKGPIDCARQIVVNQGIGGLWRGFTGSLAFRSGFFFMFLGVEALMRLFGRLDGTSLQVASSIGDHGKYLRCHCSYPLDPQIS